MPQRKKERRNDETGTDEECALALFDYIWIMTWRE